MTRNSATGLTTSAPTATSSSDCQGESLSTTVLSQERLSLKAPACAPSSYRLTEDTGMKTYISPSTSTLAFGTKDSRHGMSGTRMPQQATQHDTWRAVNPLLASVTSTAGRRTDRAPVHIHHLLF